MLPWCPRIPPWILSGRDWHISEGNVDALQVNWNVPLVFVNVFSLCVCVSAWRSTCLLLPISLHTCSSSTNQDSTVYLPGSSLSLHQLTSVATFRPACALAECVFVVKLLIVRFILAFLCLRSIVHPQSSSASFNQSPASQTRRLPASGLLQHQPWMWCHTTHL